MSRATQHFVGRADALLIDVQQLLVDKVSEDDVAAKIRDAIVDCMMAGKTCVVRLAQVSLDLASGYPSVLPSEVWDAEMLQPGPLPPALHCMVNGATATAFQIASGFSLVVISAFHMHSFRSNLRGKLPLEKFQAVQVCSSLSQVALVLRDPHKGCPEEDLDSALDRMASLADML